MKISNSNIKKITQYALVFLVPTVLIGFFIGLYSAGLGVMFPQTLSPVKAILSGLASLCFFIFLLKSKSAPSLSYIWRFLLSVAYGMCSHALIPSAMYESIILYSLLPVLILSFEDFMLTKRTIIFYVCTTTFLLIEPVTTTSVLLLLFLILLFKSQAKVGTLIADILHYLIIVLFAVCTTAVFSLPAYKEYFDAFKDYSYPGFGTTMPLSNFVARFFAGAVPTTYYATSRNISIYFGLFFLLLTVLYFFCNELSVKERLNNLLILFILLGTLEISSLQYVFDLFTSNQSIFIPLEGMVVFLCLLLSGHTLSHLSRIKTSNMILGICTIILLILFAFGGSYMNFHSVALSSNLLFLALYAIIILLLWKKPQISILHTLVYLFIGLELVCNLFLVTNQNIFPTTATSEVHYIWDAIAENNTDVTSSSDSATPSAKDDLSILEEKYNTFSDAHTDYVLINVISTLLNEVELTEDDYTAYNEYGLLNPLDEANAICRKIGASEDLFTPCELIVNYPESDYYSITDLGSNVYNIFQYELPEERTYTYVDYQFSTNVNGTIIIYDTYAATVKRFDNYKAGTLQDSIFSIHAFYDFYYNYQLQAYQLNPVIYEQVPDLLAEYKKAEMANHFNLGIYYTSLILTIISVFIVLLLFVDKKDQYIKRSLLRIKTKISQFTIWERIHAHFGHNYVYYLSFSIPVLLYVMTMIVFNCIPFGPYSFFDEDGLASSLPTILSGYYNFKDGNTLFSPIAGYGYSPYVTNNTFFYHILLTPFAPSTIPIITLFCEAIFMGLTSLSMAYYLTHRISGHKAKKEDYRVLFVALIYTLNTYMLAVHCFPTWYYAFMAFPLLMLAYDRLMYKKTWGLYVFALSVCMFTNIHLSIFICIFLVIMFFTYHFENWKDFLEKGVRFAFFSILTAGCNLFRVVENLVSMSTSFYQENDSVFPSFEFFTSFWDQWKQLFVFTPSIAVNRDNGHINLYMGIFTLILLGIYITSKRISTKEKLCKLIPILILTISFNENVLSYIWNGFHYQSNVPNRYVFLLMYLCATMSYDALRDLKYMTTKRYLGISGLLTVFLVLCHVFENNTMIAYVSTLILLILYIGMFLLLHKKRLLFVRFACGLLLLELSANMFYTVSNYGLFNYSFIDGFEKVSEFANSKLEKDNCPGRISTPGAFPINSGIIYNVPSGSIFNSYVSAYQSATHYSYGFLSGDNYTSYNYNSTPLGLALSGHKYIFLSKYAAVSLPDNIHYKYIGNCENYFVFENPNTLSLGFYVPETIRELTTDGTSAPFHNSFVSLYTGDDTPIYDLRTLTYAQDVSDTPDSFSYSDQHMNPISVDEAQKIVEINAGTTMMHAIPELYIHMNLMPESSGEAYLFYNEFIPLGSINAKESTILKTLYPNPTLHLNTEYQYFVFNQDVFEKFMTVVSQNQMENVVMDNNRITGTTHYENNGYTMLSIPYDAGWRAYIDGVEVDVLVPYDSFIMFETPAGDHKIELVYERTGMKFGIIGTFIFIGIAILLRFIELIHKYFKTKKKLNTIL